MASREAFDDLVLGQADRLKAIAYAYLKDEAEADDVVQTAYLKAWSRWSELAAGGRAEAWIERVVRNASVDRWRRRRLERPPGTAVEPAGPPEPEPPPSSDPERQLRQVQDVVASLPEPYRSVVIMRFVQRMSYEQIALELDQPLGTVKTHLCRAVRRIRSRIAEQETSP